MEIEEVVRGKDLLLSTARQILLYEALGWKPPQFFHTNLIVGPDSKRLAKRTNGLMIRELRRKGFSPETVLSGSVEELIQNEKWAPGLEPGTNGLKDRYSNQLS